MTKFGIRSLQLSLGAIALSVAGLASAQATAEPPPAAAAPAAVAKPAVKKAHKKQRHHHRHHGQDVGAGSSSAREAAAARQEASRGRLDNGQGDQYQRNALARCQVFKTDLDRQACVGRMTNGQISGAVQEGGALREYTQQVPAR